MSCHSLVLKSSSAEVRYSGLAPVVDVAAHIPGPCGVHAVRRLLLPASPPTWHQQAFLPAMQPGPQLPCKFAENYRRVIVVRDNDKGVWNTEQ